MFNLIPLPYRIAIIAATIAGAGTFGYIKGNASGKLELERYTAKSQLKIAELEKKNLEISNSVITKYVDRTNTIKEKEYVYLDAATKAVPNQSIMSNGWVYLHDASATGSDADTTRSSDATSSGIKDTEALAGIVTNYARCQQNANQLMYLQKWVKDNQSAIEESNKKKK